VESSQRRKRAIGVVDSGGRPRMSVAWLGPSYDQGEDGQEHQDHAARYSELASNRLW